MALSLTISIINMYAFLVFLLHSNLGMKFRNYVPHDKQLQDGKVAPPVLPKFDDPVAAAPPPSEDQEVLVYPQYHF